MRSSCFYILLLVLSNLTAQAQLKETFSFNQFKAVLKDYHPVAQQANLLVENAQQDVRMARAPFDPKVSYQNKQKTYTGTNYYNYQNVDVSVPTWLGVDFRAGYENNTGQFVNDEITLGNSYYVGGELNLTKGIYMNERRAALQQAKLMRTGSEQERKLILNDLYYNAYQSYFKWLKEFITYRTYNAIYDLNKTRYVQVKNTWLLGNAPAIDTVEAQSQLQQFEILKNKSYINWREEGIKLSQHVWDSLVYTKLVRAVYTPDTNALQQLNFNDSSQQYWLAQSIAHPELALNDLKLDMLRIKRKLYFQELLPDVGVGAYALQNDFSNLGTTINGNNRFGINISLPLRLSKGRAGIQLTRNEMLGTQFKRDFTQRKIQNQILFQLNEINITQSQLDIYNEYVANLRKLYLAENIKYRLGSSTVFLINSRENKFLDAQIKRLENAVDYQLSILRLYKELVQLEEL